MFVTWEFIVSTVSQDQSNATNSLVELVEALQKINASALNASVNEDSIEDGNGERIIL